LVANVSANVEPAQASGVKEVRQKDSADGAGKNTSGVFARIFAGLKAGNAAKTHETAAGGKTAGEKTTENQAVAKSAKNAVAVSAGAKEKVAAGSSVKTIAAGQGEEKKETDLTADLPSSLSRHEKNLIGNASAIAGKNTEQTVVADTTTEENAKPVLADGAVSQNRNTQVRSKEASSQVAQNMQAVEDTAAKVAVQDGDATVAVSFTGEPSPKAKTAKENAAGQTGHSVAVAEGNREAQGQEGVLRQAQAGSPVSDAKEDPRGRSQKRGAAAEIRDIRLAAVQSDASGTSANSIETRPVAENGSKDVVFEVRLANHNGNSNAATTWESRTPHALENMLSRELNQQLNGEIVRQASLVLRDANSGTIRLALKPETLGDVKIRLEMAENKITGYIVVESEEAMRAFEREMDSLQRQFIEAGFEGAQLEMSLSDGGAEHQLQDPENEGFLPGRIAASRYDDSGASGDTQGVSVLSLSQAGLVNVLA
jgi:flagellar hook-length control protein FliK